MSSGRYARGDHALGLCERCSKKMLLNDMQYDGQYNDLLVCPDCWDPKHPQEYLPEVHDPVTLLDPTGDGDKAVANLTKVSWPPTPGQLEEVTAAYPISVQVVINQSRYSAVNGPTDVDLDAPTPPTPQPSFANVAFLGPWWNETNGATPSPEDSSNATVIQSYPGSVSCEDSGHLFLAGDTTALHFGAASTGRVVMPLSQSHLEMGAQDFCIECFMWFDDFTPDDAVDANNEGGMGIVELWYPGGDASYALYIDETDGRVKFRGSTNGTSTSIDVQSESVAWALNTEYHLACVRDSGVISIYLNGEALTLDTNTGPSSTLYAGSTINYQIGSYQYFNSGSAPRRFFVGDMAHYRHTIGEPVYTGTFTVPTTAHPTS